MLARTNEYSVNTVFTPQGSTLSRPCGAWVKTPNILFDIVQGVLSERMTDMATRSEPESRQRAHDGRKLSLCLTLASRIQNY